MKSSIINKFFYLGQQCIELNFNKKKSTYNPMLRYITICIYKTLEIYNEIV